MQTFGSLYDTQKQTPRRNEGFLTYMNHKKE